MFDENESFGRHYPFLYSIAYAIGAKKVLDIGIGSTTSVLRAAVSRQGGTVYSCDIDVRRFQHLLNHQTRDWRLFLEDSETFLKRIEPPFDLVCHDGAHDYRQVRRDLEIIMSKMRKFGIVVVHDTQQVELGANMLLAIHDICDSHPTKYVHLPYGCGLTIIRVEESPYPPLPPPDANTAPWTLTSNKGLTSMKVRAEMASARIRIRQLLRKIGLR